MVVVLGLELSDAWLSRLREHVGEGAMVLTARLDEAEDLARRLPVAMLLADLEPLTTERLLTCARVREVTPGLVTVYLGPNDVRDQLLSDSLPFPDFWLTGDATPAEVGVTVRAALEQARLRALTAPGAGPATETPGVAATEGRLPPDGRLPAEQETLLHLMSALTGNADTDRLLASYVAAAAELTRCASYCFLWQEAQGRGLRVKLAQGLHPQVVAQGRLGPQDALPEWYRHSNRVLTRGELSQWSDTALARAIQAELAVFRGQVAVPLTAQGSLWGLLILGEKVLGESYTRSELETLFLLSGFVAVQVQNLRLQGEAHDAKAYLERSLGGMRCGLLTLGTEGRIVFCNPYAARALGMTPEQLHGADLRALPSPLGDHLYAACRTPDAALAGQEVTLSRLGVTLRVSTAALTDEAGQPTGSVMLLEDITQPEAERDQSARKETMHVLSGIVGRLAHEVRTPLTAIRTYAQLLSRAEDDAGLNQFWDQTVRPELERLERLIDEQLKLLQQPDPQLQLVSLETLVREASAELCLAAPEGGAPELTVGADLPEIVADPAATQEALLYLLRYLRREAGGRVRIVVETRQGAGGPRVVARLSGGSALRGRRATDVLDPLHALQQPEGDLGPAISRQIIERQGGFVEVAASESVLEFDVVFPVLVVRRSTPSGVHANG